MFTEEVQSKNEYTIEEFAYLVGISVRTAYTYVKEGVIQHKTRRLDGKRQDSTVFSREDVATAKKEKERRRANKGVQLKDLIRKTTATVPGQVAINTKTSNDNKEDIERNTGHLGQIYRRLKELESKVGSDDHVLARAQRKISQIQKDMHSLGFCLALLAVALLVAFFGLSFLIV